MNSVGIRDSNEENLNNDIYKSESWQCDEINLGLRFRRKDLDYDFIFIQSQLIMTQHSSKLHSEKFQFEKASAVITICFN